MCPYYLPSYRDPKAILTQVCWIIQSNPHLQYVQIDRAPIKDDRDARLLITSIFGLRKLQTLNVDIAYWRGLTDSPMNRVRSDVFFACPPTLQSIRLSSHQRYLSDNNVILEDYIQLPPGTPQTWEKSDEECGLLTTTTTALPRRQEPLLDLKDLSLGSSAEDITDFELLLILQHCPNLTTLKAPSLPEVYDVQDMAQKTAQYCPKLSDLSTIGTSEQNFSVQKSMVLMLQTLPEQQVTRIQCTGSLEWYLQGLSNAGSIFRRHSSTLRKIFITGCRNLDSKVIQAIVVGCEALEQLNVTWAMESNGQRRLCIDLDDAVEFPWACTKLQELTLTIAIPDHPFHLVTEGVAPYYERPPPTAFSAGEKQQLKSLETLYRQIGALTNMRKLDLRAEFYDPEGRRPLTRDYKRTTFPGMLSLGCERTGRPGFLRLLAGLTQLGLLLGTVTADTKETKIQALARNTRHVRQLILCVPEIVYYTNCMYVFQDQLSTKADSNREDQEHRLSSQERPLWLPPPDPRICAMFPMPPIRMLTKLGLDLDVYNNDESCPYYLPSCRNPKATLAHVCWIMDCNPNLVDVILFHFFIKDQRDIHLLSKSITGLKKLQSLHVEASWRLDWMSVQWRSDLFFSCSTTVQYLGLDASYVDESWRSSFADENLYTPSGDRESWERSDKECGLAESFTQQESYTQLTQLWLWDAGDEPVTAENFRSMLARCPNLTEITLPTITGIEDAQCLAEVIIQLCPKLSSIEYRDWNQNSVVCDVIARTLAALPEEQVKKFSCRADLPFDIHSLVDARPIFRRQSSTLCDVYLDG
ncbi:hypothetical protein BGX24_008643 [Mortierella sp. AD032]|nr:hypothetical protein BGX24_008643 [Mortierella sp. AD032]